MKNNKKIKIHVKNNHWAAGSFPTDAEGEKNFTITRDHLDQALKNFPEIKEKVEIFVDWDEDNFKTSMANSDILVAWNFSTINNSMEVKVGQLYKIDFNVENYGSIKSSGKAIYDVSPKLLKKYFVEIDCFCYKKQTLLSGEKSTYSITFYIDPKMINDLNVNDMKNISISYTFLDSKNG